MRILILIAILIGAVPAEACRGHGSSRGLRSCFANQKTVVGAVEMFNLDRNCRLEEHVAAGHDLEKCFGRPNPTAVGPFAAPSCVFPGSPPATEPRVIPFTAQAFEFLKGFGYLQSVPQDPTQGPGSELNYAITTFGNGSFCFYHGSMNRPPNSAREQLQRNGVTDPAMLARASDLDPARRAWHDDPTLVWCLALFALGFLHALFRGLRDPEETGTTLFFGGFRTLGKWLLAVIPLSLVGLGFVPFALMPVSVGTIAGATVVGLVSVALGLTGLRNPLAPAPIVRRPPPQPRALPDPAGLRCAVCASDDGPTGWVTCPSCDAAHHRECWTFQDGCAAFGCEMAHGRWRTGNALPVRPARSEPAKPRPAVGVNWIS